MSTIIIRDAELYRANIPIQISKTKVSKDLLRYIPITSFGTYEEHKDTRSIQGSVTCYQYHYKEGTQDKSEHKATENLKLKTDGDNNPLTSRTNAAQTLHFSEPMR